ncbi:L-histidine N(alpha)-methyltransferase [Arthrobacter roseus]|uniref:L-histidine N(alpha)-methyltransferase n=1 Tax=Arthrobacter roseus TaxID=136274 RepID=UPI00196573F7|nr:L-histidine N(alpha)-methyltransferase [Arthrobacter roseus]MBM7846778.1 L-histidine N-alpha-methyltransferase [Arthrobacter roseus]
MNPSKTALEIVHHLPPHYLERTLREDVRAGLGKPAKTLPPKWFYDQRGSELFEQITQLPEYFPTRAERRILEDHAREMAGTSPAETLIELGSGSSRKTPLLLDALMDAGDLRSYVAVDVSDSALTGANSELSRNYSDLTLQAVAADFESQLQLLPKDGRRMVAFLGGTIGNLEPDARAQFLIQVRELLGQAGGSLLLGTGLVQPPEILIPAYDDPSGVTADFNRNVLRVLNAELGADFDVEAFEHVAVWNEAEEWIEMRLRATRAMYVQLPGAGLEIHFDQSEDLRTEVSAKFRPERIEAELAAAQLTIAGQWTDPDKRYAMTLAEPF